MRYRTRFRTNTAWSSVYWQIRTLERIHGRDVRCPNKSTLNVSTCDSSAAHHGGRGARTPVEVVDARQNAGGVVRREMLARCPLPSGCGPASGLRRARARTRTTRRSIRHDTVAGEEPNKSERRCRGHTSQRPSQPARRAAPHPH